MSRKATRTRDRTRFGSLSIGLVWALGLLCLAGCSDETGSSPDRTAASGDGTPAAETATATDARPSIVLIVVESLRTDAVASYGPDRRSPLPRGDRSATPNLDGLAAAGTRYAWAIAGSSDSVTSHTSIFTGLPPQVHAAGLWTQAGAAQELETVAERLAAMGYETVGFSENPMAGTEFGLDQGFERFVSPEPARLAERLAERQGPSREFDVVNRVRRWARSRDPARPYFLFINLADAHLPYGAREDNPYLPPDVSPARVQSVLSLHPHNTKICKKLPDPESLTILGALYLHEVEAADRKVGQIVELTRKQGGSGATPITIVTADHGTHFGEQKLLGHHFSVDNRVIRVPLVVDAGMSREEAAPLVIEQPVAQHRIAHSILCWAGDPTACADALPRTGTGSESESAEPILSIAGNEINLRPPAAVVDNYSLKGNALYANALCAPEAGLAGRNLAYFKGTMKYVWRQNAADQLFDLRWDAAEMTDQIDRGGDPNRALRNEVETFVERHRLDQVHREPATGSLRSRAENAYHAAREALIHGGKTATDAVWFAQLAQRQRADSEIAAWITAQLPLHEQDPFYPIIDPSGHSPIEVPEQLARGVMRFPQFLLASVAGPDDFAMRHLETFLDLKATDYILTHQLTALEWARAMDRPLPARVYARRPAILEAIAKEHAADPHFDDLWVERAAFLVALGNASAAQTEEWTRVLVDHHLGGGDWGHTGRELTFDGQSKLAEHPREHIRGMAMIVLARYLSQTQAESTPR